MARRPWKLATTTTQANVSIRHEHKERLDQMARKEQVTRSEMLRRCLDLAFQHLDQQSAAVA